MEEEKEKDNAGKETAVDVERAFNVTVRALGEAHKNICVLLAGPTLRGWSNRQIRADLIRELCDIAEEIATIYGELPGVSPESVERAEAARETSNYSATLPGDEFRL